MGGACFCRRRKDREDQNGLKPIGGSEIGTSLAAGHCSRANIRTSSQALAIADLASDSVAGRGAISDTHGDARASGITDAVAYAYSDTYLQDTVGTRNGSVCK